MRFECQMILEHIYIAEVLLTYIHIETFTH